MTVGAPPDAARTGGTRVGGLVLLAVAAGVVAPVGWGWLPAGVAWGWAVWRSPWPGDLLDRAVPVVLVGAAALQTLGWVTPWLPGRDGPWWLVVVVAPFVLRRGATVGQPALTWRTVGYTAAGLLPAAVMCWPWLVGDVARRLDYFGWGGDFGIHAEILRDVLVAGGTPAALEPPTGFGGYPSSVQVLWGWLLTPLGINGQASPAGLVVALGAAVAATYTALGLFLAWTMRRVLALLPGSRGPGRDLVGMAVVVLALTCWPFPALLAAGFAPYPAVVALNIAAVGLLAVTGARPVALVAVAATVVVTAGSYPLLLVVPLVAAGCLWWRVRDRLSSTGLGVVAAVTVAATLVCLPPMAGRPDVVTLAREWGIGVVVAVVTVASVAFGWFAVVVTRRAAGARRRESRHVRTWIGITIAFGVLVVGYSAAAAAIAEGGDILHLPLWLLLPVVAVLVAGWATPTVRDVLRPVAPAVLAVAVSSAALVVVGWRVTGGVPYYVEKALYASLGALLPVATAATVLLVAGRPSPWAARGAAIRPLVLSAAVVMCVGAFAAAVPRQGSPLQPRSRLLWWVSDAGSRYLVDGAALLAVSDAVVAKAGGAASPRLGPGAAMSPPMSAEAWQGVDDFGVGSWFASQRWLWALTSTFREDVYTVARQWWQERQSGNPDASLASILRGWHADHPGRRLTLLVPDAASEESLRRALVADGVEGVDVQVGPTAPGLPLARATPEPG